ncbi:MAG TPA: hypothetical protein VGM77_11095 [Gemmatimonadales bacterium]|jgi:hypothetical protein
MKRSTIDAVALELKRLRYIGDFENAVKYGTHPEYRALVDDTISACDEEEEIERGKLADALLKIFEQSVEDLSCCRRMADEALRLVIADSSAPHSESVRYVC